jgi:hypothetical protein
MFIHDLSRGSCLRNYLGTLFCCPTAVVQSILVTSLMLLLRGIKGASSLILASSGNLEFERDSTFGLLEGCLTGLSLLPLLYG